MECVISLFQKELSQGGGGQPVRQVIPEDANVYKEMANLLKQYAAWSPIVWKDDIRKSENFEVSSIIAIDWEVDHGREFPIDLYQDAIAFSEFVRSLQLGDSPSPDYAHATQHGARLIWLCDRDVTDAGEYCKLAQRLCLDFGGDLQATGLASGFTCGRHLQNAQLIEVTQKC